MYKRQLLIAIAFAALMTAYVTSDYSLETVWANSHSAKPLIYKIAGVWGNHEGSMVLWVLILGLFGAAVATYGTNLPKELKANVLAVQGSIGVAFLLFIVTTSNPFMRLDPAPFDGQGLNPVLQDPALAFHPPFLYTGYVGFSMAFSFAVAALIDGRIDAAWARWVRPWTLAAWMCLTLGIAMGSWWAYYELGWGGFWFWDPVENASFMPWLVGTALIHSLAVTEKRGSFEMVSRESALLANNVLLLVATAAVLLGTLYPLLIDALGMGKLSVGPPYFEAVFVPLMAPALFLMGIGPITRWKQAKAIDIARRLRWAGGVSFVSAIVAPLLLGHWTPMIGFGVLLAAWIVTTTATNLIGRLREHPAPSLRAKLAAQPGSYYGMLLAHCGMAVFIIGVTLVKGYETEKDLRMEVGDTATIAGYTFRLDAIRERAGPNYNAAQGTLTVTRDGQPVTVMHPEKRLYTATKTPMTEAAIDTGFTRDLYASLGEPVSRTAWSVRIHHKPFIDWIWFGCLLMALGGLMAVLDRRYRSVRTTAAQAARPASAGASGTPAFAARTGAPALAVRAGTPAP